MSHARRTKRLTRRGLPAQPAMTCVMAGAAVVLVAASVRSASADPEDGWLQWGGPNRNSISAIAGPS